MRDPGIGLVVRYIVIDGRNRSGIPDGSAVSMWHPLHVSISGLKFVVNVTSDTRPALISWARCVFLILTYRHRQ